MAAPTNATNVKKALANSEPSTHGTFRTWLVQLTTSVPEANRTSQIRAETSESDDPEAV